jgi:hypothetical protein
MPLPSNIKAVLLKYGERLAERDAEAEIQAQEQAERDEQIQSLYGRFKSPISPEALRATMDARGAEPVQRPAVQRPARAPLTMQDAVDAGSGTVPDLSGPPAATGRDVLERAQANRDAKKVNSLLDRMLAFNQRREAKPARPSDGSAQSIVDREAATVSGDPMLSKRSLDRAYTETQMQEKINRDLDAIPDNSVAREFLEMFPHAGFGIKETYLRLAETASRIPGPPATYSGLPGTPGVRMPDEALTPEAQDARSQPLHEAADRARADAEQFRPTRRGVTGTVRGGIESTIQSAAASIPGTVGGALVGGPLGAVIGFAVGGGGTFGAAEYSQYLADIEDDARKKGASEKDIRLLRKNFNDEAIVSALAEGGFEAASNLFGAKVLGFLDQPVSGAVKKSLLETMRSRSVGANLRAGLKKYAEVAGAEVPTEMATSAVQNDVRVKAGVDTGRTNAMAAKEAIAPTLIQTGLMAGAGAGLRIVGEKRAQDAERLKRVREDMTPEGQAELDALIKKWESPEGATVSGRPARQTDQAGANAPGAAVIPPVRTVSPDDAGIVPDGETGAVFVQSWMNEYDSPEQKKLIEKFIPLATKVLSHEKTPDRKMSSEESDLMAKDWKAYSKSRGYTDEEITDFENRLALIGEGEKIGIDLGDFETIETEIRSALSSAGEASNASDTTEQTGTGAGAGTVAPELETPPASSSQVPEGESGTGEEVAATGGDVGSEGGTGEITAVQTGEANAVRQFSELESKVQEKHKKPWKDLTQTQKIKFLTGVIGEKYTAEPTEENFRNTVKKDIFEPIGVRHHIAGKQGDQYFTNGQIVIADPSVSDAMRNEYWKKKPEAKDADPEAMAKAFEFLKSIIPTEDDIKKATPAFVQSIEHGRTREESTESPLSQVILSDGKQQQSVDATYVRELQRRFPRADMVFAGTSPGSTRPWVGFVQNGKLKAAIMPLVSKPGKFAFGPEYRPGQAQKPAPAAKPETKPVVPATPEELAAKEKANVQKEYDRRKDEMKSWKPAGDRFAVKPEIHKANTGTRYLTVGDTQTGEIGKVRYANHAGNASEYDFNDPEFNDPSKYAKINNDLWFSIENEQFISRKLQNDKTILSAFKNPVVQKYLGDLFGVTDQPPVTAPAPALAGSQVSEDEFFAAFDAATGEKTATETKATRPAPEKTEAAHTIENIVLRVAMVQDTEERKDIFTEEGLQITPNIVPGMAYQSGYMSYLVARGDITQAEYDKWIADAKKAGDILDPKTATEKPTLSDAASELAAIETGDFVRSKLEQFTTGVVTGEGTVGKGVPVWKIEKGNGETSVVFKADAELISKGDEAKDLMRRYPERAEQIKKQYEKKEEAPVTIEGGKDKTVSVDMPKSEEKKLAPKEQKAYLLAEIDKAIEASPNEDAGGAPYDNAKNTYGTVTIEVPNDGQFTVLNTKNNLETFRKRINEQFPDTAISHKSTISKPSKAPKGETQPRATGEGIFYYRQYRPRKQSIILDTSKRGRNIYSAGFFSTGYYAIKSPVNPIKGKANPTQAKETVFNEFLDRGKDVVPAEIVAETNHGINDDKIPEVHVVTEDGRHFAYNPELTDAILTAFPNAKLYVEKQAPEKGRTLGYFKDGDEIVGFLAPRLSGKDFESGLEGKIESLSSTIREGYESKQTGEKPEFSGLVGLEQEERDRKVRSEIMRKQDEEKREQEEREIAEQKRKEEEEVKRVEKEALAAKNKWNNGVYEKGAKIKLGNGEWATILGVKENSLVIEYNDGHYVGQSGKAGYSEIKAYEGLEDNDSWYRYLVDRAKIYEIPNFPKPDTKPTIAGYKKYVEFRDSVKELESKLYKEKEGIDKKYEKMSDRVYSRKVTSKTRQEYNELGRQSELIRQRIRSIDDILYKYDSLQDVYRSDYVSFHLRGQEIPAERLKGVYDRKAPTGEADTGGYAKKQQDAWTNPAYKPVKRTGKAPSGEADTGGYAKPFDIWFIPDQEYSSQATSINASRLPSTFSRVTDWKSGTVNADIGGGRFDNVTEHLKEKGVASYIYDPFNRSPEHNRSSIAKIRNGQADTATINNVLNVIQEEQNRAGVIQQAADALKPKGTAYFLIYEGDESGTAKATPKGWQENRKAETYLEEISTFFEDVTRRGNLIEARKPRKTALRVGKFVNGEIYLHGSAIDQLPQEGQDAVRKAESALPDGYQWDVFKWKPGTQQVSFMRSPDWDATPEPYIENSIKVVDGVAGNLIRQSETNPVIYHGKGFMVKPGYKNFSREESIRRYYEWNNAGIPEAQDKNRIGRKQYWETQVLPKFKPKRTAPSGFADVGGYSNRPPSGSEYDMGGYTDRPLAMQLPEIVDLAQELLDGKLPRVVKVLRGLALGRFEHGTGSGSKGGIKVRATLFKDLNEASKVLAHEIGHLIDWLPDKIMTRGNILGHIASLSDYMKHWLAEKPGAPGPLTPADRRRLRRTAEKMAQADAETWVDEEISRQVPITPTDVLAIWNSTDFSGSPELLDFVKRMTTAEKKSVVKDALKGQVAWELQAFAKTVKEKTGKKIKLDPAEETVLERYHKLIEEEIAKRRLFSRDQMTDELRRFSLKWKPFDPEADKEYTQYRFKPTELYADALSALITDPLYLKSEAPHFYEGFMNYMDAKPTVRDAWKRIQDRIRYGTNEADDILDRKILDGFKQREREYSDQIKKSIQSLTSKDAWLSFFYKRHYQIFRYLGILHDDAATELIKTNIRKMIYSGSEGEGYVKDLDFKVLSLLNSINVRNEEFGLYLFHNRVGMGDRKDIANPYGAIPERSRKRVGYMLARYGPELEEAREEFRKIREEWFISKLESAEMYSDDMLKLIQETDKYATFDIVGHMKGKYGGTATGQIHHQIGTFSASGNVFTATVMKDIALMRSVNRNNAVKSVVSLFEDFGDKLPMKMFPAKQIFDGKRLEFVKPDDADYDLVIYLDKGKAKGVYLPQYIAESLNRNEVETNLIVRILRVSLAPFKAAYVGLNTGFQMFNIIKDYQTFLKQIPGAKTRTAFPVYIKRFAPNAKSTFSSEIDPVTREMLHENTLIPAMNYMGLNPEETQMIRLLRRYGIEQDLWHNKYTKPIQRMLGFVGDVGQMLERQTKTTSWEFLKENQPGMSAEARGTMVVERGGSPDFLTAGTGAAIFNNVFMFTNPMIRGWESAVKSAASNPGQYVWKTFLFNVLPKIGMFAAASGLFGWWLKELYARVSKYDMLNYNIIPLGFAKGMKAVYFRNPQDETGRFFGGMMWKLLNRDKENILTSMFDYAAGQAPALHPMAGVLWATVDYMSGQNPYDHFRGRTAIDETVFSAGGMRSHKEFAKWLADQTSGGIVFRFTGDSRESERGILEKVTGFPFLSNTIGRFVKVSNSGLRQELSMEMKRIRSAQDEKTLRAHEGVQKMLRGKNLSEDEKTAVAEKLDSLDDFTKKSMAHKYGDVYMEMFLSARSNEEKKSVLDRMFRDPMIVGPEAAKNPPEVDESDMWDMNQKAKDLIEDMELPDETDE